MTAISYRRAQIRRARLVTFYAIDRDDHPAATRKKIVRDIFATSDEAILADDGTCIGKHWWPGYVAQGETCGYCGWTKTPV